jgi:hypothetical protein
MTACAEEPHFRHVCDERRLKMTPLHALSTDIRMFDCALHIYTRLREVGQYACPITLELLYADALL